jgi:hypothetical protein
MAAEQVVEQVTEQVAGHLEEAAVVTRRIDARAVGFFAGGIGVGIAIGFFIGHRYSREKIKAEAFAESKAEVEEIRETYHRLQSQKKFTEPKPSAEEIIAERGYATGVDAAGNETFVRPDGTVVEVSEPRRLLTPPVPVNPARPKRTAAAEKDKNDGWNYPLEMSRRNPQLPHIIHQDEFATSESGYTQSSITYYNEDDVLADETDEAIEDPDALVGLENLQRFGHGTDDVNILYVRNPKLELEYEIVRHPGSFAEEVLGLDGHDRNDAEPT